MTAQLGAHEKPFRLEEAPIEELHAAIKSGQTTCVAIVQHYIDRQDRGMLGSPLAQERGMMQQAFAYPFMYWVGMNTHPDTDPTAVAEFSRFYSTIHVPEVVASNPGFVRGTRYELLHPDPRGDWGPRWLAVYEMDGEAAHSIPLSYPA